MSDGGAPEDAPTATLDVADPVPSLPGSRPFARPTPAHGDRQTAAGRRTPFVAPTHQQPDPDIADPTGGVGAERNPALRGATMLWPAAAEIDAAHALEAVASRLRAGTLRLPIAVDASSEPEVLAAALAALHARRRAGAEPQSVEGGR